MHADRMPVRPIGPPRVSAFGEPLRRKREALSLTLDSVADTTRIARHHLEALERSDLGALPSGPFGKGYLRTYAKLLGLDPEPILDAYRAMEQQRGVGSAEAELRMLDELSQLVERRGLEEKRPALRAGGRAGLLLTLGGLALAFGALGSYRIGARVREPSLSTPPTPSMSPALSEQRPPVPERGLPERVVPLHRQEPPESRRHRAGVAASQPPTSDALEVSDQGVGTRLVDRWLVGQSDRFPEGTRVAFWTRVLGGQPGQVIRHVWFREGQAVMSADLPVGGPHWRTYSRLLLAQGSAGSWATEARTSDGRLLARQEFLCEAAGR